MPESKYVNWERLKKVGDQIQAQVESLPASALLECYAGSPAAAFTLTPLDTAYTVPTIDGLHTLLTEIQTQHFHYTAEQFDCDDFAWTFKCLANLFFGINGVGFVINYPGRHSYNLVSVSYTHLTLPTILLV